MSLFDKEFYPTPEQVAVKMLAPYAERLNSATILEPSAGSGAILDVLTSKGVPYEYEKKNGKSYYTTVKADPKRVYAIEKNEELSMILHQKGYKVIGSDFLTFWPEHRFDLLALNPPFSNGDDHLLHAWEILDGGDIVCLLNAETIHNPFSAARQRLKAIIAEHGSVEFIGQAFKNAENPTDIEVAIVRLHKEAKDDPFKLNLDGLTQEKAPDFSEMAREGDSVAVRNGLDAYIRSWQLTKVAAVDLINAYSRFLFFAQAFLDNSDRKDRSLGITEHILKSLSDLRSYSSVGLKNVYNDFLDSAKSSAWNAIIDQIGLGKYMTGGLRQKLNDFRNAQGTAEITKENINALFNYIMFNINDIMNQTVVEVYDIFTRYFKGNTDCDEGWKTNKRFRCNRKIILPDCVDAGYKPQIYGYDRYYSVSIGSYSVLDDIDKAMCWLSGTNFDELNKERQYDNGGRTPSGNDDTIYRAIKTIPVGSNDWHDSRFFRIKAFKKGTLHLEFKDEDLWNRFNIAVNQGKNQLGMAE